MTRWQPWALALILLLSACRQQQAASGIRVMTGKRSAAYKGPVAVYLGGQSYPEPYEEVAIIRFGAARLPQDRLVSGLMAEARKVGANAVIQVRLDWGKEHSSASGIAVRYGAPPAIAPAPRP